MKHLFLTLVLCMVLGFLFPHSAGAVQAYPHPVTVTQPDGTTLTLQLHGDEYLHWTTCGGRLVTCGPDGYYYYAQFGPDGYVQATLQRVVTAAFAPLVQASVVRPPQVAIERARQLRLQNKPKVSGATRGTTKSAARDPYLVFLVGFSDVSFRTSRNDFEEMLNGDNYTYNGATGSAKQYFSDNSDGTYVPEYIVFPPVTINYASTYFGSDGDDESYYRAVEMFERALFLVDSLQEVDFTQYDANGDGYIDNVFFYFAGHCQAWGAANTIWPHSWDVTLNRLDNKTFRYYACTSELLGSSGTTRDGIGTFCHEFGHRLGLEDVYDTDYEENGSARGLGDYSLMAGGNYNNESRTPPYLNCLERYMLGWMDAPQEPTASGKYTLPPITQNKAYVTSTNNPGETFLYENRQKTGWDAYLPGHGMLIYHSDKSENPVGHSTASQLWPSNAYAAHQCFDLVEAVSPESAITSDAQIPFPGTTGNTSFTATSSPAALTWSGSETGSYLTQIAESGGNVTFTFTLASDAITALGYHSIFKPDASYAVGDHLTLAVSTTEDNPTSVAWTVNNVTKADGEEITFTTSGTYIIKAVLTYADRTELIVQEIVIP